MKKFTVKCVFIAIYVAIVLCLLSSNEGLERIGLLAMWLLILLSLASSIVFFAAPKDEKLEDARANAYRSRKSVVKLLLRIVSLAVLCTLAYTDHLLTAAVYSIAWALGIVASAAMVSAHKELHPELQ